MEGSDDDSLVDCGVMDFVDFVDLGDKSGGVVDVVDFVDLGDSSDET